MLRRTWQSAMFALAKSQRISRFIHRNRAAPLLARKYVAGADTPQAVTCATRLLSRYAVRSSLAYLGEDVARADPVAADVAVKLAVIPALADAGLDLHVSVDPGRVGHATSFALARHNAVLLAEEIHRLAWNRAGLHCLMLDMEDAAMVDATIGLHDEIRRRGLPVALTLQAHLKRTARDLLVQVAAGARVRLVKGAFVAGADIAYTRQQDIKANYRRLVELMFSRRARRCGFYPIIATHDQQMHEFAIATARSNGWKRGQYEFEMLFGVRSGAARVLAERGERVRLYVPFGRAWWPYAVRRIGENPRNAALLARSLVAGRSAPARTRAPRP